LDDDGDLLSDADEATAGTDSLDTDTDDDGDDDYNDQFPLNSAEWDDSDSDAPAGSDGTGYGDNSDAFVNDACANVDTDGDGMPDTIISGCTTTLTEDTDDDGDGILDAYDDFPTDAGENTDTDNDGIGNAADDDDDADGYADVDDWAPIDSSEWWDTDGDGIGNNADSDDDADGTPDGDDTYPLDYDNDDWDDAYEIACGTDRYSSSSTPSDNDGDTVKYAVTGVQTTAVNLCDALDDDDDNDGYLDPTMYASLGGGYFTSLSDSFTLSSGSMTISMTTTSWASEAGLTLDTPSATGVDLETSGGYTSFGNSATYTWTYSEVGDYTIYLTDSYGDGGQSVTVMSVEGDQFQFDYEAWDDTDGDGLTDYIDPNSTAYSYDTVQLCGNTPWYTASTYSDAPTGVYLAVSSSDDDSNGDTEEDAECTFTLPAGETLDVVLNTASYGGEAIVDIVDPSGTNNHYTGFGTNTYNTVATFTTAGTYTIYYGDSWGDGCNPGYYGACYVQASYSYITGTVAPTVTVAGTVLDMDDDNDGYSDLDETTNCDDGGAYASSSLPLDASSTPDDMDGDLTCDALDSDRDGDGYANAADIFPDDVSEWVDTDADGTGNNADTDDDADGTLDIDDAWSLDACADTDSDGDGYPDSIVDGCTTTLTEDQDDDNDGYADSADAFPLDDAEWHDTDGDGIGNNADNDDDGDGVNDGADVWPLNECATTDTDGDGMPDSTTMSPCGATIDATSFEGASTGGQYTDTGDSTLNHTLANNAGEADVNFSPTTDDGFESGDFSGMSFTNDATYPWVIDSTSSNSGMYSAMNDAVPAGGGTGDLSLTIDTVSGDISFAYRASVESGWDYLRFYVDGTLDAQWSATDTGWNSHSTSVSSGTHTFTWRFYRDSCCSGGANTVWLDDISIPTSSELGYTASYISTGGVGLTNDYFGVTDYAATVGSFTDGSQGYQMSDTDGIAQLTFGSIDASVDSVSIDLFIQSTGWETSDYITISYVGATSTVTLFDTNGYDINIDFPTYEGVWTTLSADVSGAGSGNLVVEFASNSGSEAIYLDNVIFQSDGITVDDDDDNDGHLDVNDDCPLDANEYIDTDGDGYCDVQDTDDDNDGTYDLNDEFPLDPNETSDFDGDGIGDNADLDDDNDGVNDDVDALPNNPDEWEDYDGDGVGDNADLDDDNDGVSDEDDAFPYDSTMSVDTDGDGIADYTSPAAFQGDFESGSLGGGWTTSGSANWFAQSTTVISGFYSAESGDIGGNQDTWLTIDVNNMINDTDTDSDGIPDMASISFAYSVSTEGNWDYFRFCVDTVTCSRLSGTQGWSGLVAGTHTELVAAGNHTFHFVYFKDSIIDGNDDTVWLDDVTVSWPTYQYNLDTDDDNDGVLDDDDLDPVDPCLGIDTDGDGFADVLGSTQLNGTACDPADYTIDEDDDDDSWSDADEATCGSDPLVANATPDDNDGDAICDVMDSDDDNDGVDDGTDAFPMDSSEVADFDGDGIGDNADVDDDNDNVTDGLDAFPNDASETIDTDGDGTGDNADTDDDADGVDDVNDAFPLDATEWDDTDSDGLGDNKDPDDDGDGVADVADPFPLDSSEWADDDGDGIGNNADDDDDGDGYLDNEDAFPEDPSEWIDSDGDGQGDNSDADDDGDGINDGIDEFPMDSTEWIDSDGDGIGDNSDTDDDGDGVLDVDDAFPSNPAEWDDFDGDGVGDNQDSDDDADSEPDVTDAFPYDGSEWDDTDNDGTGDNADTDDDNDGWLDAVEEACGTNTLDADSMPADFDGDETCDALDDDISDSGDRETEPVTGLDRARQKVPGFTSIIASLALLGAALAGRRKDD
tara:strand:- start:1805 stop:7288 length:5484 start_codon:yes stop_codon:yes gene_type:complete